MFYENNGPSKHTSHSMMYAPISPRRAPYTSQPFYLTNHVFYENNGRLVFGRIGEYLSFYIPWFEVFILAN